MEKKGEVNGGFNSIATNIILIFNCGLVEKTNKRRIHVTWIFHLIQSQYKL